MHSGIKNFCATLGRDGRGHSSLVNTFNANLKEKFYLASFYNTLIWIQLQLVSAAECHGHTFSGGRGHPSLSSAFSVNM
jgi:hypothetical protein